MQPKLRLLRVPLHTKLRVPCQAARLDKRYALLLLFLPKYPQTKPISSIAAPCVPAVLRALLHEPTDKESSSIICSTIALPAKRSRGLGVVNV